MARRYVNPQQIRQQAEAAKLANKDALDDYAESTMAMFESVKAHDAAKAARDLSDTAQFLANDAHRHASSASETAEGAVKGLSQLAAIVAQLAAASVPGAGKRSLRPLADYLGDMASSDPKREARARQRDREVRNALSERVPSEGGFLVGEDWSATLLEYSIEHAIVRPRAIAIPSSTLRLPVPIIDDNSHASSVFGGIVGTWAEEGSALNATVPTLGRAMLEAKKCAMYLSNVANELVADSPAFAVFFERAMPAAMAWYEDAAFIAGTGAGQPQGVINARCAIEVTRAGSGAVQLIDLAKMSARLMPTSQASAIWLISPDVLAQLLELYVTLGSPTSGISAPPKWLHYNSQTGTWELLGRTCYPTEHVPALGSPGDVVLADFSEYVIEDKNVMEASVSTQQHFGQDESDFKLINRVDGRMWRTDSFTPANGSQALSSVIVLD